ncbi:hypothetical protein [Streptomyces sp. NPDC002324]
MAVVDHVVGAQGPHGCGLESARDGGRDLGTEGGGELDGEGARVTGGSGDQNLPAPPRPAPCLSRTAWSAVSALTGTVAASSKLSRVGLGAILAERDG